MPLLCADGGLVNESFQRLESFGVILPSWLFLCLVALLLPSLTGVKLGFFAWDSLPFVSLSPILAVIVENAVIVVILLHGHV